MRVGLLQIIEAQTQIFQSNTQKNVLVTHLQLFILSNHNLNGFS